jgi:uncharacterized membrane protein
MNKGRMEAFSDGVIAILITIMVLQLTVPRGDSLADLRPLLPVFLSYILSFVFLGIYWTNHHHLLQAIQYVDGRVLWANMHLLFWLSLIPFGAAWMGQYRFTTWPIVFYGAVLCFAGIAYFILVRALIALHGQDSVLAAAVGSDFKGKISVVIYLVAILVAFFSSWAAFGIYVLVAIIWLVPDRRIEKNLVKKDTGTE